MNALPPSTLGERIRHRRRLLGMTLVDLTLASGVKGIGRFESGIRRPLGDKVEALADALGVSWFWLLTGQDPAGRPRVELEAIAPLPVALNARGKARDARLYALMEANPLARVRWLAKQAGCARHSVHTLVKNGGAPPSFVGWSQHQSNQALLLSRWTYHLLVGRWMCEALGLGKEVGAILGRMRAAGLIELLEPEWLRPHQLELSADRVRQSGIYGLTRAGKLARKALLETQP